MPSFSKKSLEKLSTCHDALQDICLEAIKQIDFAVICGHRTEADQNKAFAEGKSKLQYPNSKHNKTPSLAVDLAPVKYRDSKVYIDWEDIELFKKLAAHVLRIAAEKGILLVWGGNWVKFKDYPHYELKTGVNNNGTSMPLNA